MERQYLPEWARLMSFGSDQTIIRETITQETNTLLCMQMFRVQFISSGAAPVQLSIIEFKAKSVVFAFKNVYIYVSCESLL